MTTLAELPAGFADKVLSAQSTFRSVMDAMARPGSVQRIAAIAGTPRPMLPGTAAIALTLFDHDTPLWLDPAMSATPDAAKWLKFHTSAPVVTDTSASAFALVADAASMPALDRFAFGTPEYPDRSTTLILQIDSLTEGPALELRGPGIDGVPGAERERASDHPRSCRSAGNHHAVFPEFPQPRAAQCLANAARVVQSGYAII